MLGLHFQKIVDDLNIANGNTLWQFNNGDYYWQNLLDLPDDCDIPFVSRNKYFFLLWETGGARDLRSTFSDVNPQQAQGQILLSVRSRIMDKDYNYKYLVNLRELWLEYLKIGDTFGRCDGFSVVKWDWGYAVNNLDTNLDSLVIDFTVEFEADEITI